jgi:Uma2 family endonuclease
MTPGSLVVTESGWQVGSDLFIPDVMVIAATALDDAVVTAPPPELVIEITSPSTRPDDWGRKLEAYAVGGAPWYWIVDLDTPEVTILENRRGGYEEVLRTTGVAVLPPFGVTVDPAALVRP